MPLSSTRSAEMLCHNRVGVSWHTRRVLSAALDCSCCKCCTLRWTLWFACRIPASRRFLYWLFWAPLNAQVIGMYLSIKHCLRLDGTTMRSPLNATPSCTDNSSLKEKYTCNVEDRSTLSPGQSCLIIAANASQFSISVDATAFSAVALVHSIDFSSK